MRPGAFALAMACGLGAPAFGQVSPPDAGAMAMPVNCAIRPSQVVEVAAPIGGIVRKVFVKPGQSVTEGSQIAEFDSDLDRALLALAEARATLTAGLAAATANRDALRAKVERLEVGLTRRVISAADLEAARMELTAAEGAVSREAEALVLAAIEVDRARVAVDKAVVLAPVSGVIGEDPIDPGENASAKPIAVIYVTHPLRVEAYVPTAMLAGFLARDGFEIVVNGNGSQPIAVTLDYVSQVADLSSNTQSVFFTLDAPGILPGYQCIFARQK